MNKSTNILIDKSIKWFLKKTIQIAFISSYLAAIITPLFLQINWFISFFTISLPIIGILFLTSKSIAKKENHFTTKKSNIFKVILLLTILIHCLLLSLIFKIIKGHDFNIPKTIYSFAINANAIKNVQTRSTKNETAAWKAKIILNYMNLKFNEFLNFKNKVDGLLEDNLFGFRFKFINYKDLIHSFNELFIHRIYYFNTQNPSPKIIDCGSNIGLSVLYFKTLYPNSEIIAFEPDTLAFSALEKNITNNKIQNVKCIKKAVALDEGTIKFFKKMPGSTMNSIVRDWNNEDVEIVETTKLSNYINEKIDFFKLDVEGAERLVLVDLAKNDKLKFIKEMMMEFHHHLDKNCDDLANCLKVLEDANFGYQFSALERPPFTNREVQYMMIYAYNKNLM